MMIFWKCIYFISLQFWTLFIPIRVRAPPKINWIQICILVIGVFIGVAGFIATITLCCLYSKWGLHFEKNLSAENDHHKGNIEKMITIKATLKMASFRYKRRIRRSNIKIVEAPVRALIPASLPPGILIDPSWSLSQKFSPALFFAITNITAAMSMTMPTRFNNGSTRPITDGWSSVWPGGTLGDGQQWKVGCVTCIT